VQDQVATFRLISNILKAVSLLMAAITVFIVTYIDVVNRRRHIGIQRAIGIPAAPILAGYALKAGVYASSTRSGGHRDRRR
jgi:putative ABC transport system permease protein